MWHTLWYEKLLKWCHWVLLVLFKGRTEVIWASLYRKHPKMSSVRAVIFHWAYLWFPGAICAIFVSKHFKSILMQINSGATMAPLEVDKNSNHLHFSPKRKWQRLNPLSWVTNSLMKSDAVTLAWALSSPLLIFTPSCCLRTSSMAEHP